MKIIIIQLGWSGHGVSGGDKHLLEAAEFWQTSHDVSLFLPSTGRRFVENNFGSKISAANFWTARELIPFHFLNNLDVIILSYAQRIILSPLQVLLSLRRFDVAVASSHFLYDLLPAVFLKVSRRAQTVVYLYHLIGDQGRPPNFRNWLSILGEKLSLSLIGRFFDLIVTDNSLVQGRLGQEGLAVSKIKVVPPGIRRPIVFEGVNKKYDLCFLGRLVKSKGVFDLVEVMKLLREKFAGARLAVMGTGDESTSLRNTFDRASLSDSVIFLGEVDETIKYQVLQESKVFVSPSYEEGWGIALAEALSCGLPAVVYDLPVVREVFGDGPVRVPVGDRKALAEEAIRLLAAGDYYRQKSAEGLKSVENYYLDLVLPKELEIIEDAGGKD